MKDRTELEDLSDETLQLIGSFDPEAAYKLSLCSRRFLSLFNEDPPFQKHYGNEMHTAALQEKLKSANNRTLCATAQLGVINYINNHEYLLDHEHVEDPGYNGNKKSISNLFVPSYDKGWHRAHCFLDILRNKTLPMKYRIFALYTLLNEKNGVKLKEYVNGAFIEEKISSLELSQMNEEVERQFPKQRLRDMQRMLLNEIHNSSYKKYYKTHGYSLLPRNDADDYWHTFFCDLKKEYLDEKTLHTAQTKRCSIM